MSLPSHMSTLGSLRPSDPVVTSVPAADWAESDPDSPSFVANKPTAMRIPAALSFGQKTYDGSAAQTLTAADLGALTSHQDISGKADKSTTYTKTETDSAISTAVSAVKDSAPAAFDTLKEIADWIGDSGSGAQAVINQVAGKADKSEMSVTPGTGANADKTTIQLKNGTSATVLTAHQSLAGYATTEAVAAAVAGAGPYALVTVAPTAGAPFVLAACFPIKYVTRDETEVTVTAENAQTLSISGGNVVHDGLTIFSCNSNGTFAGEAEIDSVTFGDPATPPTSSTQVLGFTPTYALADRTTNQVVVASPLPENGIALAFPAPTAGKVRDFLVRLEIPAGDAPQIAYTEGVTFENADGSFPEINTDESAAASTLLMFTETAPATGEGANATPARFLVKGEALKEVS